MALQLARNPLLTPRPANAVSVEAEMKRLPHLTKDRSTRTRRIRRDCRDARKTKDAAQAIEKLPEADEAIHVVICGRYALADVIPATFELAGEPIGQLHVCTLGFSRKNVETITGMLDAGSVAHVRFLCSHYFKSTSSDLYELAQSEFAKRAGRAEFLSCQTHAKLLVMKLASGRTVTVESSANARSCRNIEQMCIIGDPTVYAFHRAWIDELFALKEQTDRASAGPRSPGLRLDPQRRHRV